MWIVRPFTIPWTVAYGWERERGPTSDCKESPFNLVRFRETAERNHGHLVLRGVATREADRSAHAFPCNNAAQPKKLV